MVEIHVERTIAAPAEQVFDWLADPVNLAAAPLVLRPVMRRIRRDRARVRCVR